MGSACPGCGAAAEFSPHAVRAVQGTCSACGGTFTVVEPGSAPDASAPAPRAAGAGEIAGDDAPAGAAPGIATIPGPDCAECGTSMVLETWTAEFAKAACPSCGEAVEYRTAPEPRETRFERAPPFRGRDRAGGFPPQRGRPCRECGGQLTFSTDAEGNVTGACTNCGNRFTLPPRPRGDRPGPRGRPGGFSRGFVPRFQRSGGRFREDNDRGPRRGPPRGASRGPPRRTYRRNDDGDDDDRSDAADRRRRRPRRE